nr:NAD-dependent protein deacetylase [Thiofilum flexile]
MALQQFAAEYPRWVVLTGAGVSLSSGIPTYRDEKGIWQRPYQPIQHQEFIQNANMRRRYWARSFLGWATVGQAQPNRAHSVLAELEQRGTVSLLITQNVDNLHQRAGSKRVIDLHGNLSRVVCLSCGTLVERAELQARMQSENLHFMGLGIEVRPDGDAELDGAIIQQFNPPHCSVCGGDLMPDVVFFGGIVPSIRVAKCMQALELADALVVVGSSLKVYSGYRFCVKARELGKPIVLINPGWTRADELAQLKITTPCVPALEALL